ncbi:radical SAM protein [Marinicella sp. S1101]|uniref:B12-binding domain-containing radical SAM protein n=1 Tax=Marinicella marina TaxID=2996016 RepID=UPI002260F883|nr:radical SAM protein [Marinicella marina]MCX7552295.1 radical SAM protein [Marinicella marina]MDJ1139171.1 radical SAM protein [Marinicella marina]
MQLNQDFLLLNRKGQSMISQISGVSQPFMIHEPDVLLLSLFFNDVDAQLAADQFIDNEWVKKWLPHAASQAVLHRIEQFKQAGIFNRSLKPNSALKLKSIELLPAQLEKPLPENLALSSHAAVSIHDDGFFAYSAIDNQCYQLPVAWVILMLAFGDGQAHEKIMTERGFLHGAEPQQVLATLLHHGFLIPQKQAGKKVEELNQFAEVKPTQPTMRWQDLKPDGRIPVYFVPHMENHFPMALGVIYSALANHNDGELLEKFQLIPITFLNPNDLLNGPYRKFKTGVWLFSNYMWSMDVNLQVSQAVKTHDKRNLTIHGGPSTPEYKQANQDFMQAHPSVDIAVMGEGEVAITEIFAEIYRSNEGDVTYQQEAMSEVTGVSFRDKLFGGITRTAKRQRMAAPDSVPSPYLDGIFDVYDGRVEAAIIESNRGCPFGCTFCDWGSATNQKVRKFDLDRVKKEIEWIGKNKVRVIWIADANFGLYDRDIELSQFIVDTKEKYGFPQEVVVNYTKNSTWRLVEIIKIFTAGGIISQGIISIQTTDEKTLEVINRKNIKTEKYDELTKVFYDLKLPLSTDLMIGLPGITVEAFNNDLQKYIDMDVSVKAYPTQLLPNSPMADPEYIEKYQIKTDEKDFVIASYSFTEKDLQMMKAMYQIYTMADGYSLLRYVIRYLQWEHDIRGIDFLQKLLKAIKREPNLYPQIAWAVKFFNQDKSMPGGWSLFYQQVADFIKTAYGIEADSGLQTILEVNQLCMPDDRLSYPMQVDLAHDFTAYFAAKSSQAKHKEKPLSDYPPAKFHVSDPNSMVSVDLDYLQYDSHQFFWELHSDVARPKSVSEFAET